jgi:hypothetical protein
MCYTRLLAVIFVIHHINEKDHFSSTGETDFSLFLFWMPGTVDFFNFSPPAWTRSFAMAGVEEMDQSFAFANFSPYNSNMYASR